LWLVNGVVVDKKTTFCRKANFRLLGGSPKRRLQAKSYDLTYKTKNSLRAEETKIPKRLGCIFVLVNLEEFEFLIKN
jgi:hypothetical protein